MLWDWRQRSRLSWCCFAVGSSILPSMGAVHATVYGILSPFLGWLVLGRMFPYTYILCLLWFVQGSLFPLLLPVMFCWFPACLALFWSIHFLYLIKKNGDIVRQHLPIPLLWAFDGKLNSIFL
jgi:hypothetical protein